MRQPGRLIREGGDNSQVHQGSQRDLLRLPHRTTTYLAIAWPNNATDTADLESKRRAHNFTQEPKHPTCHAKPLDSSFKTEALSSHRKLNTFT